MSRKRKSCLYILLREKIEHQLVEPLWCFHIHHMANSRQHYAARARDIALDQSGDSVKIRQVVLADDRQHAYSNLLEALGRWRRGVVVWVFVHPFPAGIIRHYLSKAGIQLGPRPDRGEQ